MIEQDEQKISLALRLYSEGEVGMSRAAEIAEVSLWEIIDLIEQAGIPNPYTLEQAVEDIRQLLKDLPSSRSSKS
jgi:predicted HTH domain antitoxin